MGGNQPSTTASVEAGGRRRLVTPTSRPSPGIATVLVLLPARTRHSLAAGEERLSGWAALLCCAVLDARIPQSPTGPSSDGAGRWGLWETIRPCRCSLVNKTKRPQSCPVLWPREATVRRLLSPNSESAGTMTLDLSASRNVGETASGPPSL